MKMHTINMSSIGRFAAAKCALLGLTTLSLLASAPRANAAVSIYSMMTTQGNTIGTVTYLAPDNDPTRIYMVMPNGTPNGVNALYDNNPIGVWYDRARQNWSIFNESGTAMPIGTGFNVWTPQAASNVYVHVATAANTVNGFTYLDNQWLNGNPNALAWVTQNYNPNGIGGTFNRHNVGLRYDIGAARWFIINQDQTPINLGASFNIVAEAGAQHPHYYVARSSSTQYWGRITINSVYSDNYPNAQIFVTPVYNPGGTISGVYNNHALIVRYDANIKKWYIENQDGVFFTPNAAFNVWVVSH
jgi:hypothetical protein